MYITLPNTPNTQLQFMNCINSRNEFFDRIIWSYIHQKYAFFFCELKTSDFALRISSGKALYIETSQILVYFLEFGCISSQLVWDRSLLLDQFFGHLCHCQRTLNSCTCIAPPATLTTLLVHNVFFI